MYNSFFNFKNSPFKNVPDPDLLFSGKSHQEALAHLTYAVSQGIGFIKITGEVGTGKTTLCRAFLENLDKDIEAAFIFNSKVNAEQLLKAILNEFDISRPTVDPADMISSLNQFLLEKKSLNQAVILLIDEAQNLSLETLEQLRLLSNLETTKSKLLQIILVGQPELNTILDSYQIRQLRQRISLSYRILPLTRKETKAYIEHRVNISSITPQSLFGKRALGKIYKYSNGIPRLINRACDRILLAAYSIHTRNITSAALKIAFRELDGQINIPQPSSFSWKWAMVVVFMLILFGSIYFKDIDRSLLNLAKQIQTDNPADHHPKEEMPMIIRKEILNIQTKQDAGALVLPDAKPVSETHKLVLDAVPNDATREEIFSCLFSLWQKDQPNYPKTTSSGIESDQDFFETNAILNNYRILSFEGRFEQVKRYNLPTILEFIKPNGTAKQYLVVIEVTLDNEYIVFTGNKKKRYAVNPIDLSPYLTGKAFLIWKDGLGHNRTIFETSPKASILSVKLLLQQIGYESIHLTPVYDSSVKTAVKQIQKKYRLKQDGIIGPLTKIMLYNEKREAQIPYLDKRYYQSSDKG